MDELTHVTTDYDDWVTDPDNLVQHIANIARSLSLASAEEARLASIRRRWPYLVNPQTGHLNERHLCWICASALVHTDHHLPRMRACRWCLVHDRRNAARFGLKHLLPVFDWPTPPIVDAPLFGHLDTVIREAATSAWSAVSLLDQWRRDCVQLAYGYMDVQNDDVVDLFDWQARLTIGPNRSRACWDAYVGGYHPALRSALRNQVPYRSVQR